MNAKLPRLARMSLALLAGVLGLALMNSVLGVTLDLWINFSRSLLDPRRMFADWWVAQAASAVIGAAVAIILGLLLAALLGRNRVQLSIPLLLGFNLAAVAASFLAQPNSVPALIAVFYTTPIFWTFQLGCVLGIWLAGRSRRRVV